MNLVDSCGWLEYFEGGPNAGAFAGPIEDLGRLVVPTVVIMEVYKRLLQQQGRSIAKRAAAHMQLGNVVALDQSLALQAAVISDRLKLPLADSIILATARRTGAIVWTQDDDFKGHDGVNYIPYVQRKP